MNSRNAKLGVAVTLVLVLVGGIIAAVRSMSDVGHTRASAYFDNSNGIYVGDDVVILGVPVGKIEKIEPQHDRVKISFWYDNKYRVPADAKAVILAPSLVTVRVIQLTPAYTGGPGLANGTVIPRERTAVPVEWDDLRQQLEKLTQTLQPTQPGGVSTLGSFINTAADNLRGQGSDIRDTVLKLSQAVSALGDHSGDLFSTLKNLAILVSALRDSSGLLRHLNQNLAAVTGQLANDPNEVGHAVRNLNDVVGDVTSFLADNREAVGTTSDKLASVSQAVTESLDDIKQTPARCPYRVPELREHLPTRAGHAERCIGAQQFRQPDPVPVLGGAGRIAVGRRAVGEAVRAVSGADHQEPSVQLPAAGRKPVRRCLGASQRSHLQRGLAAA